MPGEEEEERQQASGTISTVPLSACLTDRLDVCLTVWLVAVTSVRPEISVVCLAMRRSVRIGYPGDYYLKGLVTRAREGPSGPHFRVWSKV